MRMPLRQGGGINPHSRQREIPLPPKNETSMLMALFLIVLRLGQLACVATVVVFVQVPLMLLFWWEPATKARLWVSRHIVVRFLPQDENY